ncbi:uncharacterized protein LOC100899806 [Galendromus occidentalis]|uniref:Uncharacterized protein LOC100899806 n=1 Tax=Galendromus occidentalis TaxID=34638 RepID=A0AAJ6QYN5_9ACAR|nr:uncharacterized protein LOC100899806 [Galendromus occidentalis]
MTYRARELNRVPDPRSTLCQRTDMLLGVMDTTRSLAQTDNFVFENPKGGRISAHIAAAASSLEAVMGLVVGTFLLIDAENQKIVDHKPYIVYTYLILHGLALLSSGLLIWANKRGQLDLIVAWIAIQICTGVVFICGTLVFLVIELSASVPLEDFILGVPFIYFSSALFIFIVIKVCWQGAHSVSRHFEISEVDLDAETGEFMGIGWRHSVEAISKAVESLARELIASSKGSAGQKASLMMDVKGSAD